MPPSPTKAGRTSRLSVAELAAAALIWSAVVYALLGGGEAGRRPAAIPRPACVR